MNVSVGFDPNHKVFDLSKPFDDLHVGQLNEEEREQELIPIFSELYFRYDFSFLIGYCWIVGILKAFPVSNFTNTQNGNYC